MDAASYYPGYRTRQCFLGQAAPDDDPDRVQASLRLRELFKGHIVLPEVEIGKPRVLLEKNAEGKANWDFQMPHKKKEKTPMDRRWFPKIERLTIDDGRFGYNDPLLETQLDMNIFRQGLENRISRA